MEMGIIRTKVSRSQSEIRAFLSLTFCSPNPTYDIKTTFFLKITQFVLFQNTCISILVIMLEKSTSEYNRGIPLFHIDPQLHVEEGFEHNKQRHTHKIKNAIKVTTVFDFSTR